MDKTWLLQKLDLFKLLPHSVVEEKEDSRHSILSDAENIESAVAISDIAICKVPQEEFASIAKNCSELNLKIVKIVGLRFKKITSKIANLLYKDLDSRIAWALIELYEKFGKNNPVNTRLIGIKLTMKRLPPL